MRRIIQTSLATLMLVALAGSTTMAQVSRISGTVTDAATNEILIGVSIVVKGTTIGTITNSDGAYEIEVPDQRRTLVFSFVGFRTREFDVPAGQATLDVALTEDILGLEEVIVTGVATSVKRTNLANAVGTVSAADLVPAPAETIERALNGKMAGLYISQNTGAPGGGINVNLRGTSTITGDTQPLYVVDGVIIDNTAIQSGIDLVTAATGAGSPTPQGQPTNRIADLNPNDIESIEVLKGASAAAIYGSKATNGVVIITTKRGAPGRTHLNITQQVGSSSILRKLGTRQFTPATAEATMTGGAALLAQNGLLDYEELMYGQQGFISETSASLSGGNQNTRFYVSGLALNEDGIVKNTGYSKYSGKVNIEHRLGNRLTFDAYTTILRSESDRSITGNENQGSTTLGFAQVFTLPFIDLRPDANGVFPSGPAGANPLQTIALLTNNELVNRAIGTGRVNWNLLRTQNQLLDLSFQGGADFYSAEHKVVSPPELQFEQAKDPSVRGISISGETTSLSTNVAFSAIHRYSTPTNTNFTSSAGYQYESRDWNNVLAQAQGLLSGTRTNVDLAPGLQGFQTRLIQRERGFFFQEEVDLDGKIFLTGGLRADASSRIGDTDKYFLYPKLAASLRLSQYPFWDFARGFASEFKLRTAFGRTGNLPLARAKFTSFRPENTQGLGGALVPTLKGNPDIKPEITQEIEAGVDMTLFNERGTLEFTYYDQSITDLILENELPASSGYESQFINAGDMATQGIEISLELTPLLQERLRWTTRFNFSRSWSEVTSLSVDPFEIGGFALSLGQFKIQKGLSPTTIVGLDEKGKETIFGNENPDFQLAMNNNFTVGNFNFNFLWDWKQGGDVINLGAFLSDLGGTTPDLDTKKGQDRLKGVGGTGRYIENGTYLKLREVSLVYNVDRSLLTQWFKGQVSSLSLGVSGRNLLVFTDYTGYDPEVSQFGNVAIGRSVDVIPFPSARSFYFKVALGF